MVLGEARADGQAANVYARDVTDRKQAERALRESTSRFGDLFSALIEGFALHEVIRGPDGEPTDFRFLDINPAFERLTGQGREIIGRTHRELFPDDDPTLVRVLGAVAITREPERLFQPFAQAKQTLDRSAGGLGIGLALVKRLVELHGGRVAAHSAGVGAGAEFLVELPREPDPGAVTNHAARDTRPGRRRILIIEDNADAAESLREVLELEEHEVAVAAEGTEGIRRARELRPDVVLCDIGLPGMDGYAVARALRADEVSRGVHLIALSGYALPEDVERAAQAGFDGHLAKPPSLERLQELIGGAPGGG